MMLNKDPFLKLRTESRYARSVPPSLTVLHFEDIEVSKYQVRWYYVFPRKTALSTYPYPLYAIGNRGPASLDLIQNPLRPVLKNICRCPMTLFANPVHTRKTDKG